MKTQKAPLVLSWLIAALALIAAGTGVMWQGGSRFEFTTLRGQAVEMWGSGLYRFDSVSGAAQELGQDVVTLCIGIPLLLLAAVWSSRGSLRGRVLLAGTLGYFLYTYTSMAMLTAYNELFLVYVALFSLSLFAFIMAFTGIDAATLAARFDDRLPRRAIGAFLLFVGVMLIMMWVGRLILPALLNGTPPAGLESYTTLVIQTLDLGIVVPTAMLAGVLILRRAPFGYLLSTVVLIKAFTMGAAVLAMIAAQLLAGVAVDPTGIVIFGLFTVLDVALVSLMLRSLTDAPGQEVARTPAAPAPLASAFNGDQLTGTRY